MAAEAKAADALSQVADMESVVVSTRLTLARAREEADGLKARLASAEGAALAAVNDATQARAELQDQLREARAVAKSVQRKSSSDLAAADAAADALRRERDEALARAA